MSRRPRGARTRWGSRSARYGRVTVRGLGRMVRDTMLAGTVHERGQCVQGVCGTS